jgi:hypothetical protein
VLTTTIKDLPMLFIVPMVRSLLAGIKGQTRRKSTWAEVGQIIWVKETYAIDIPGCPGGISYKADHQNPKGDGNVVIKWKSPLFMPRSISRIQLLVTGFRSERLQDITEADAIAEGLNFVSKTGRDFGGFYGIADNKFNKPGIKHLGWAWEEWEPCPIAAYRKLWDSINDKDPEYCWDANPLINVINFEVLEINQ